MRKLALLALTLLPLAACTAILGDFTVGTSPGDAGDSGSPDTLAPPDGGDAGDAGADAPPPLLKCAEPANVRAELTSVGTAAWDRISVATVANGQIRAVVNDGSKLHAITFSPNQPSNAVDVTPTDQIWNVLDVERYGSPGSGGYAALVAENVQITDGGPNNWANVLFVQKMPDTANAWTSVQVTPVDAFFNTTYRLEGVLVVLDATSDDYFLLNYMSIDNGASYTLYGAHEKVGQLVDPMKISNYTAIGSPANSPYDLSSPAAFFDGQNIRFSLAQNGPSGGPDSGAPLVQGSIDLTATQPNLRSITAPNASDFAMGMTGDTTHADLAFLIGNLATVPMTGAFHLGSVALPDLATYLPEDLPAASVPLDDAGSISLQDLPIDKSQFHWEAFGGVNNFFGVSRTADFLQGPLGGVNLLWADTTHGFFMARQTGPNRLLADVAHIYKANITYTQAVGPSLVQFVMVFEEETDQNGQPQPGNLWVTNINCAH